MYSEMVGGIGNTNLGSIANQQLRKKAGVMEQSRLLRRLANLDMNELNSWCYIVDSDG